MRPIAEVHVGEELPERARVVTAADVRAYADAGGDQNPLHQDDAFARGVGFPGIVAHGMFTMGHMAACLMGWTGRAGALEHLSAQFRAPVFVGEEIVAGGTVTGVDQATDVVKLETWVTVVRDGSTEFAVRKGSARVRLRRPDQSIS